MGLLQWAAPRLRLRWEGFRRVRGQVCKRIFRRMKGLGLLPAWNPARTPTRVGRAGLHGYDGRRAVPGARVP